MVGVHHIQDLGLNHVLHRLPYGVDVHGWREDVDAIEATLSVFMAVDLGDELNKEVALAAHGRAYAQPK